MPPPPDPVAPPRRASSRAAGKAPKVDMPLHAEPPKHTTPAIENLIHPNPVTKVDNSDDIHDRRLPLTQHQAIAASEPEAREWGEQLALMGTRIGMSRAAGGDALRTPAPIRTHWDRRFPGPPAPASQWSGSHRPSLSAGEMPADSSLLGGTWTPSPLIPPQYTPLASGSLKDENMSIFRSDTIPIFGSNSMPIFRGDSMPVFGSSSIPSFRRDSMVSYRSESVANFVSRIINSQSTDNSPAGCQAPSQYGDSPSTAPPTAVRRTRTLPGPQSYHPQQLRQNVGLPFDPTLSASEPSEEGIVKRLLGTPPPPERWYHSSKPLTLLEPWTPEQPEAAGSLLSDEPMPLASDVVGESGCHDGNGPDVTGTQAVAHQDYDMMSVDATSPHPGGVSLSGYLEGPEPSAFSLARKAQILAQIGAVWAGGQDVQMTGGGEAQGGVVMGTSPHDMQMALGEIVRVCLGQRVQWDRVGEGFQSDAVLEPLPEEPETTLGPVKLPGLEVSSAQETSPEIPPEMSPKMKTPAAVEEGPKGKPVTSTRRTRAGSKAKRLSEDITKPSPKGITKPGRKSRTKNAGGQKLALDTVDPRLL